MKSNVYFLFFHGCLFSVPKSLCPFQSHWGYSVAVFSKSIMVWLFLVRLTAYCEMICVLSFQNQSGKSWESLLLYILFVF